jgi:hypothetical protein
MYRILIRYQTGDSFHTEDREEYVDMEWEDISVAAENLTRIQQHYEMYKEHKRHWSPSVLKEMKKEYGDKDWFIYEPNSRSDPHFLTLHSLYLYTDDGGRFRYSCFWCGYFETLYGASIEQELPQFTT